MISKQVVTRCAAGVGMLGVSAAALGQTDLVSNRSVTASVPALGSSVLTQSGVIAPVGAMWSEVAAIGTSEANAIGGLSTHRTGLTGAYRFADDFVVTDPTGWTVSKVALFAYQTGASPLASPFGAVNVQIWNGRPGDVGSVVVYGDTVTNRMVSSVSSGVYRVFNTVVTPQPVTPDTTRLIWRTEATMGNVYLPMGTYWLDWQYVTINSAEEAFSPTVTIAGERTQAGANGRQLKLNGTATAGTWVSAIDPGKPATAADVAQEFPFIVSGFIGTPCTADFNVDGLVNSQDFFDFIGAFFVQSPTADVNRDNMVNSQDFFDFLSVFFVGC